MAQAGAAAAEALVLIDRGHIEQEPNTAHILDGLLRLQVLPAALPLHRHHLRRGTKKAVINEALCKGCGTCVGCLPVGLDRAKPVR